MAAGKIALAELFPETFESHRTNLQNIQQILQDVQGHSGVTNPKNDNAFNSSHACPILEDVYQSLDRTRLQPLPRTAASA